MTLKEFVERIKLENNISYETNDIIKFITKEAEKQQENNVACISDEDVKNLIINFKGVIKKEKPKEEVKNDCKVQNEQISLL